MARNKIDIKAAEEARDLLVMCAGRMSAKQIVDLVSTLPDEVGSGLSKGLKKAFEEYEPWAVKIAVMGHANRVLRTTAIDAGFIGHRRGLISTNTSVKLQELALNEEFSPQDAHRLRDIISSLIERLKAQAAEARAGKEAASDADSGDDSNVILLKAEEAAS